MDPKVQSGSTAEELVENFASSATRFPACVALQELGIGALGAVHSGLGHCGRRIVHFAAALVARPQDGRATRGPSASPRRQLDDPATKAGAVPGGGLGGGEVTHEFDTIGRDCVEVSEITWGGSIERDPR